VLIVVDVGLMAVQHCPSLRHVDGTQFLIPSGIARDIRLPAAYLPPVRVGHF